MRAALALRETKRQALIHRLYEKPEDKAVLSELGLKYFEEKEYHFACDLLARACRFGQYKHAPSWKACGDCHVEIWRGHPMRNKGHLAHAIFCYKRAMKSTQYASDCDFLRAVASVYGHFGSLMGALAVLSQIIQNFPSYDKLNIVTHRAAGMLFQIGKYDDSLRYLKHVIRNPPRYYGKTYVLMQTARVFVADENVEAADEMLSKAYDAAPHSRKSGKTLKQWRDDVSMWIETGRTYIANEDYAFGVDAMTHAMSLQENGAKSAVAEFPYFELAQACGRIGDNARAVLLVQKWLAVHPKDGEAREANAFWAAESAASSSSSHSIVTLETGLKIEMDDEATAGMVSPKVRRRLPPLKPKTKRSLLRGGVHDHPIEWLGKIYKPPPSALETAKRLAEGQAKMRRERERKLASAFRLRRATRRKELGADVVAAMLIQAVARRRQKRRHFKSRLRRHKRTNAVVLQKYVRRHIARRRVETMKVKRVKDAAAALALAKRCALDEIDGVRGEADGSYSQPSYPNVGNSSSSSHPSYVEQQPSYEGYQYVSPSAYDDQGSYAAQQQTPYVEFDSSPASVSRQWYSDPSTQQPWSYDDGQYAQQQSTTYESAGYPQQQPSPSPYGTYAPQQTYDY